MKTKLFSWLGREFVELVGEGRVNVPADVATHELFAKFDAELKPFGLSLDDGVRLRVWGRDKEARTMATAARSKILTGNKRVASSSFVSQQWFESAASVGVELLAMKPRSTAGQRRVVDFDPPRNYLYFLDCDRVVFFSGFTSEAATLEQQVTEVLAVYDRAIASARSQWSQVRKLSVLLQRGHDIGVVRRALTQSSARQVDDVECTFVDGFAGGKYLIEIEATAWSGD